MAEPKASGGSRAADNPVNSNVEPTMEKDKAPDAAQAAQSEVEDWKIQAELFKSQGRTRIGKQYVEHVDVYYAAVKRTYLTHLYTTT